MPKTIAEFDVVIIGSGIAGSALACALQNSALRVLLVEGGKFQGAPSCEDTLQGFDARVSAITLGSKDFLQSLGVWESIVDVRAQTFSNMRVWDAEGTGAIEFSASEIGETQLGYIVENRVLVHALLANLALAPNVKLLQETQLLNVQRLTNEQGFALELSSQQVVHTRLLVGADGANSFVRQALQFKTREWDYQHHAIVCTIETERPHQYTAWQRFMPTGPLALLPLSSSESGYFCSIVWSATLQEAERLMGLTDEAFVKALSQASEQVLGNVRAVSQRWSFPLRQRHAVDYVQAGVALVADAAHTIHPLAGQGINLGLQDVRVLSEEILRAHLQKLPVGDVRVLSRYQRRRKTDNLLMMAVMEGFKRLFEQPSLLIKWVRNRGMAQIAKHTILKKQLIRQAMGLD